MSIYIVLTKKNEPLAVFSTLEKASQYVGKLGTACNIEEWEIDAEV